MSADFTLNPAGKCSNSFTEIAFYLHLQQPPFINPICIKYTYLASVQYRYPCKQHYLLDRSMSHSTAGKLIKSNTSLWVDNAPCS